MTKRPPLLPIGVVALALAPACGHKGDPLPPLRRTPPQLTSFRLAQRGDALELQVVAPQASVDGVRYQTAAVEFLYGTGQVDLEKAGRRLPVRVAAGANATTTLPLPAPGTLVRAAARGLEGGARGPRTLTMALVSQPPIEAPRELTAGLGEAGPELAWKGERPKEVKPPVLQRPPASGVPTAPPGPSRPAAPPQPPGSTAPPGAPPASGASATPAAPASAPPSTTPPAAVGSPAGEAASVKAPSAAGAPATPPEPAVPPRRRNGFFVYRRAASGTYQAPLGEEPLERRSFRDETAALGTTWCYVVRAVASTEPLIESAASNEVCLERRDLTAPATPAGLAVLPRPGGLELLWSPSSEEDLAGYRVYRSADAEAAPARIVELGVDKAAYLDAGARQGVVYRYTLTAFDRAGNESPPGEAVEATLP